MAVFSEVLQGYVQQISCTATELADASGLSYSALSRYLSGQRVPHSDSPVFAQLAHGLTACAHARGVSLEPEQTISASLMEAAGGSADYALLPGRLTAVLDTFGVARNRLARSMDFDPSYISRILSGQRRPADLPSFIDGVAAYIARNHNDDIDIAQASELTGIDKSKLTSPQAVAEALRRYMTSGERVSVSEHAMDAFLEKLDEFNLGAFLKEIHFDDLKVPTVPFQLPTAKTYEGIEQMKQAELDFLKAAVLSKSKDDVILYSDMPLGEMAQDEEFTKKVMGGMALLIRKGIHLHNIHDVHRPTSELFMGLEGWIPVYMTGQITPYYLPHPTNTTFLHFLRSAGTVALSGEAIAGNQGGGRYVLSKQPSDVAYVRRRAQELLKRSRPLMRIFRADEKSKMHIALKQLEGQASADSISIGEHTFDNIEITVWPNSHALIEKQNEPHIWMLIEYPALVDALERFEPTLF